MGKSNPRGRAWRVTAPLAAPALACLCAASLAADKAGAQAQAPSPLRVLHQFTGGLDGAQPEGGITQDGGAYVGALNTGGGDGCGGYGCGGVYRFTLRNGTGTPTLIYSFNGADGSHLQSPVLATPGGLISSTVDGGAYGYGTIFRLTPPPGGTGPWRQSVLHDFASGDADGGLPQGNLVIGTGHMICGTTEIGGRFAGGTVFCLHPPPEGQGKWLPEILHAFSNTGRDGFSPLGGLIQRADGTLEGTTDYGGQYGHGTVFALTPKVSPEGTSWTYNILYSFPGGAGGATPIATLTAGPFGTIFGTTAQGGDMACMPDQGNGCGTIFALAPSRYGWQFRILHRFFGGQDGAFPNARMTLRRDGTLLGLTAEGGGTSCGGFGCGTIFLQPALSAETLPIRVLYRFQNGTDGAVPSSIQPVGNLNFAIGATQAYGCPTCRGGGAGVLFTLAWK